MTLHSSDFQVTSWAKCRGGVSSMSARRGLDVLILAWSFLVLCIAKELTGFILHRGTEFFPKKSYT